MTRALRGARAAALRGARAAVLLLFKAAKCLSEPAAAVPESLSSGASGRGGVRWNRSVHQPRLGVPASSPASSPKALRSSRFSFREPPLWFPRLRLFPDHLRLEGWHWQGRYLRRIDLDDILQVDITGTGRLLVWLTRGETIRLRLHDAAAWKRAIDHHRGAHATPGPIISDQTTE